MKDDFVDKTVNRAEVSRVCELSEFYGETKQEIGGSGFGCAEEI